uniref:Uncharacterized protein n=1 Tax=Lepeophtheirus salmonis TaxID=72036 RepID=A0A0K2V195_LEPSM
MKKSNKATYVFQHDGTLAHTSNIVEEWMCCIMNILSKNDRTPQSSDPNPLDYSIWWQIEKKDCKVRQRNIDDLKTYIANVYKVFRMRLEAVIEADGGQIHN